MSLRVWQSLLICNFFLNKSKKYTAVEATLENIIKILNLLLHTRIYFFLTQVLTRDY